MCLKWKRKASIMAKMTSFAKRIRQSLVGSLPTDDKLMNMLFVNIARKKTQNRVEAAEQTQWANESHMICFLAWVEFLSFEGETKKTPLEFICSQWASLNFHNDEHWLVWNKYNTLACVHKRYIACVCFSCLCVSISFILVVWHSILTWMCQLLLASLNINQWHLITPFHRIWQNSKKAEFMCIHRVSTSKAGLFLLLETQFKQGVSIFYLCL